MEQKDIKLSEQEKAYIRELLGETRPEFREKFLELAKSRKKEDRDMFMRYRTILEEFVVPKQPPRTQEIITDVLSQIKEGVEGFNADENCEFHAKLPRSIEFTINHDGNSIHFTIPQIA